MTKDPPRDEEDEKGMHGARAPPAHGGNMARTACNRGPSPAREGEKQRSKETKGIAGPGRAEEGRGNINQTKQLALRE
eukprot:CAMPEP_0183306832 /NCGR_PEP_ID=MMETSP0160_2-20130417/14874_1 /TAXON_ID=2839 ORGANISM="Odontella Sinensis, Strain Grunow 1884" /NCGR_SAMPLE_ID=MMETSP0160_2 /ASSEMBLY_ACC=CAM_ASM_000250 /LENGTH=77 /DNA_ID=CAMNT_0025470299 /DNA_START=62 /DNA_END=293 /DNA_ORIENTATION=-